MSSHQTFAQSLFRLGKGTTPQAECEEGKAEFVANPKHLDGAADMSTLIHLDLGNVLHNLSYRYTRDSIYTSVSKVLIAVNPYKDLGDRVYGSEQIEIYRARASKKSGSSKLDPHVFAVSQSALQQMQLHGENQSLIVCGESGSGKTESAKHLMRYLAYSNAATAGDNNSERASIEQQVLDCNPILESIGNAKTVLNNNSSRFGKFTKLLFSEDRSHIEGSMIETYLLEKSRVVRQDLNERNFHVFYMLTSSGFSEALRQEFGLRDASYFHYCNQGECKTVEGIDDARWMTQFDSALGALGFSETEKKELYGVVAGILHLGNVNFADGGQDASEITDHASLEALEHAAACFQLSASELSQRLCTSILQVRDSQIRKTLKQREAEQNRDAIAKALYNGMFHWVVARINDKLFTAADTKEAKRSNSTERNWVGILDVFGFENFQTNSFEQFCINFANERLQQFFNSSIIEHEQAEYASEALVWEPIVLENNQDLIDIIDRKNRSIISVLDSTCRMPEPDANKFISALFKSVMLRSRLRKVQKIPNQGGDAARSGSYTLIDGFAIRHYAGAVVYNAAEFVQKNVDKSEPENVRVFGASKSTVLARLLQTSDTKSSNGRNTKFRSIATYFSQQLKNLMATLEATNPHFVRCIKPNAQKQPGSFDADYILPQLECGGIVESLRILKLGFPTRTSYADIWTRYGDILQPNVPKHLNQRDFCEALLVKIPPGLSHKSFQMGLSKVFFRPGQQAFLEDLLHNGRDKVTPEVVQEMRAFLRQKKLKRCMSGVKTFLVFDKSLRRMRAKKRITKLALMTVAITKLQTKLREIRATRAAVEMQRIARGFLARRRFLRVKSAMRRIEECYSTYRVRSQIRAVLSERIAAKQKLMDEQQRLEQVAAEKARREKRREAAEQQAAQARLRKQQEQETKARTALEAAQREKEQREVQAKREQEELERQAQREKEQRELQQRRKQEELERQAQREKEQRELQERLEQEQRERQAQREKEQAKRKKEELERQAQYERDIATQRAAREAEKAQMSARVRELEARVKHLEADSILDELSEATEVQGQSSHDAAFTSGMLSCDTEQSFSLCFKTNGESINIPFNSILKICLAPPAQGQEQLQAQAPISRRQSLAEEGEGKSPRANTVSSPSLSSTTSSFVGVSTPSSSFSLTLADGSTLTFVCESSSVCEDLAARLLYVWTNFKQLQSCTRPLGDPLRGNLAAMVMLLKQQAARADSKELLAIRSQLVQAKEVNAGLHKELDGSHIARNACEDTIITLQQQAATRDAELAQSKAEVERTSTALREVVQSVASKVGDSLQQMQASHAQEIQQMQATHAQEIDRVRTSQAVQVAESGAVAAAAAARVDPQVVVRLQQAEMSVSQTQLKFEREQFANERLRLEKETALTKLDRSEAEAREHKESYAKLEAFARKRMGELKQHYKKQISKLSARNSVLVLANERIEQRTKEACVKATSRVLTKLRARNVQLSSFASDIKQQNVDRIAALDHDIRPPGLLMPIGEASVQYPGVENDLSALFPGNLSKIEEASCKVDEELGELMIKQRTYAEASPSKKHHRHALTPSNVNRAHQSSTPVAHNGSFSARKLDNNNSPLGENTDAQQCPVQ